ncbi:MAG: EexN family lipoprotein [Luteimonas sp.]
MKNSLLISCLLLSAIFSGCAKDPLGPAHDVQYYKDNPEERADVIAKCDADPGSLDEHPNCINARQARWDNQMGPGSSNALPRPPDNL